MSLLVMGNQENGRLL